ncbi:MAG: hypothetical protein NUV69_03590 [Candidatus Curtissbacteria bacterium]|nr:hypothetical protein [Candidatus Curtissbacteria bacterium]
MRERNERQPSVPNAASLMRGYKSALGFDGYSGAVNRPVNGTREPIVDAIYQHEGDADHIELKILCSSHEPIEVNLTAGGGFDSVTYRETPGSAFVRGQDAIAPVTQVLQYIKPH